MRRNMSATTKKAAQMIHMESPYMPVNIQTVGTTGFPKTVFLYWTPIPMFKNVDAQTLDLSPLLVWVPLTSHDCLDESLKPKSLGGGQLIPARLSSCPGGQHFPSGLS